MRSKSPRNEHRKKKKQQPRIYDTNPIDDMDERPPSPPSPVFLLDDSPPGQQLLSPLEPELDLRVRRVDRHIDWPTATPDPVAGTSDQADIHVRPLLDVPVHPWPPSPLSVPSRPPTRSTGQVRSPLLVREPTMLESFSRTMRTYVPSSIRVPMAAPSPPHVSRPVSFGRFMSRGQAGSVGGLASEDVFGSDDEDEGLRFGKGLTTYPSGADGDGETVLWARWDTLARADSGPMQLLFLAYPSGMQIWDCTGLSSVVEILSLAGPQWKHISFAAILPQSSPDHPLAHEKPLVGMVADGQLLAYSLFRHHVVKTFPIPNVIQFSANEQFLVVSTTNPATLHILSAISFAAVFILPSTAILPFTRSFQNQTDNSNVALIDLDTPHSTSPIHLQPRAVFALSHRLLAYASPPPPPSSPTEPPRSHWMLESDLSIAAIKVGESVLSGVKTLGGMAYNAAMSKAGFSVGEPRRIAVMKPFSRSAPTSGGQERGRSLTSALDERDARSASPPDNRLSVPRARPPSAAGYFVTVLDLASLQRPNKDSKPVVIAEFMASKDQPISDLHFSCDGISLVVVPKDGQSLPVFRIRPVPRALSMGAQGFSQPGAAWHMYNLRRGRSPAVVEGVHMAHDLRWIAIATQKRTVHVFPVNPYGGKPDHQSHLEGRVCNYVDVPPQTVDVSPIARLHLQKASNLDTPRGPLAIAFQNLSLQSNTISQAISPRLGLSPLPSVRPGSAGSEPASPRRPQPSNIQDLLVFDPVDGLLALRRLTVELRSRDSLISVPNVAGTGMPLPGLGNGGRLSVSPPTALSSTLPRTTENSVLTAKEAHVATWNLRRGNWGEFKKVVEMGPAPRQPRLRRADWLAQAELSTCSKSQKVLPRSIYLSHQFTFHTLGEDYHALIRRSRLDILGVKLEVRKEVEVSAYSTEDGESFVEGFGHSRATRQVSSSFDEPLASALTGDLGSLPAQPVIPMLPNGVGSKPKSFKDTYPIRAIAAGLTEGMTEGLGRIRRVAKSTHRSPTSPAWADGGRAGPAAQLEFDEEDEEDFTRSRYLHPPREDEDEVEVCGDTRSEAIAKSHSRGEGDSGASASISTPSTTPPLVLRDDGDQGVAGRTSQDDKWNEWSHGSTVGFEDADGFDDISAVGLLDEEQVYRRQS